VPVTVLDTQLALTRLGYSPGSLDGVVGSQTRAALRTFQRENALPATGQADGATRAKLRFASPAVGRYEVAESDLSCLRPLSRSWLGKSQQERLDYETLLELVAEKFQTHPKLIRSLNPQVDWSRLEPGLGLNVPNTTPPAGGGPAATVRIRLAQRTLEARDDAGRLLAHFPCSIARLVEKRPMGTLRVVAIIRNPSYTFNPEIFPESEEGRRLGRKLHLPPGPNNPVGVAWIGLSRPGYGIHGTPRPEEVGRTESHGCFRLANWNAERLAQLVRVGTPVHVEP
jgi:lipoprotein-anchoring transpeptidase ErfK/SrfK